MHKSRLGGFIIDCRTDDLKMATDFWSKALGMKMRELPGEQGSKYIGLVEPNDYYHLEVQVVDHESRLHLDIESDDVEAEVRRLEKLGAKRVAKVHSWVVMLAPTGQKFCVVRTQTRDFAKNANTWD